MSKLSSEQLLSSLEHSQQPPIELLDEVTNILQVSWDQIQKLQDCHHLSFVGNSDPKFREQWVLRWLIKRLGQSVGYHERQGKKSKSSANHQDYAIIQSEKTWYLLNYLLTIIPHQRAQEILIDRKFCQIYNAVLKLTVQNLDGPSSMSSQPIYLDSIDGVNQRPSKRRRLSQDILEQLPNQIHPPSLPLIDQLLQIAAQTASIFLYNDGALPKKASSAGSDSLDVVSALIGNVLRLTHWLLRNPTGLASTSYGNIMEATERWIYLWDASATLDSLNSKADSHTSFNSFILIPALGVLSLRARTPHTEGTKTLERHIAIHTLLPARSSMEKQATASHVFKNKIVRDKDIEKLVREVQNILKSAADDFSTPDGITYASLLLQLASRLIPRSDVIKRKAESHWFEVLFLSLVQLLHSPFDPSDAPNADTAPARLLPERHTEQLLDIFMTLDVLPSVFVWHSFSKHYVVRQGMTPSYTLLEKTVKLNAAVFTDDFAMGYTNLADELYGRLPCSLIFDDDNSQSVVVRILCVLVDAYGKARRFTQFLEIWKNKLAETFYNRAATVHDTSEKRSGYAWDDPDFLEAFVRACRQYAPPSQCKETLQEAEKSLQSLPTIVGPTHQIFAQLTITTQVLKSRVLDLQPTLSDQLQKLMNGACVALSRTTDFQGHRWRLYYLLATIIQIDPKLEWTRSYDEHNAANPFDHNTIITLKTQANSQTRAVLMEQFCYLDLLVASAEANHMGIDDRVNNVLDLIISLAQVLLGEARDQQLPSPLWDGIVENLGSLDTFLSACIVRIAAMPMSRLLMLKSYENFVIVIMDVVLYTPESQSGSDSGLTNSAETTLSLSVPYSSLDLSKIITQTIQRTSGRQIDRMPAFLGSLISQKEPAILQDFGDVLLECIAGSSVEDGLFSRALNLLNTAVGSSPNHFCTKRKFKMLFSALQLSKIGANAKNFILCIQATERLAQTMFLRNRSVNRNTVWQENISTICKYLKKKTKTFQLGEDQKMFDTYSGFFLMFTTMNLRSLQLQEDEKEMEQMVQKIEFRVKEQLLMDYASLLEGTPSVLSIVKMMATLKFVLCSQDNQTLTASDKGIIKRLYNKTVASITEASLHRMDHVQTQVMRSAKLDLAEMASSNDYVLGLPSPTIKLFDANTQGIRLGHFEAQMALALDATDSKSTITWTPLVELVATGDEHAFRAKELSDDKRLLFAVATVVKNIKSEILSSSPDTIKAFGQIASLGSALQSWTPAGLILRLELSQMIFNCHPSLINQHIIDTTLCNVAFLASFANKATLNLQEQLYNPHPPHIFDRLCQILITILARHRRRVTGRHHLLLTALQALLKCLFYPPIRQHITTNASATTAASKATFLSSLPYWLNPPNHTSPHTLPATSAVKFARILQILCDPSVSSARRVSKRNRNPVAGAEQQDLNLVDETRLLRRQVSQHTQYLLQTYCQATLDGWISPEVKEKLILGLYAVCNATDVEVMRGMNSAMNESQRAIWKDLYADWMRWGKWNQR